MKKFYILIVILFVAFGSKSTETLLANYPLINDGLDATGNNSNMTIVNAPFNNGGIYSNGIHYQLPNGSDILTPPINNFLFNSFAVCFYFNPEQLSNQPVITCGRGWRWIGLKLKNDGTVALLTNNAITTPSAITYTINQWHYCRLTYDGTTAKLFMDGQLAVSLAVVLSTNPGDTEIGCTDYGLGETFKGWIKNLKIFDSAVLGINNSSSKKATVQLDGMNFLTISGIQNNASVTIYGLNGNTLFFSNSVENPIDLNFLPQGIFLARIQDENDIIIRKYLKK